MNKDIPGSVIEKTKKDNTKLRAVVIGYVIIIVFFILLISLPRLF